MLTKTQVLKSIESLPERFSVDDIIERLLFLQDLEERIQKAQTEDLIDQENIEKEFLDGES